MESRYGKKVWVFADGEMPPSGDYQLKGHESIVILNMTKEEAQISMTLYYTDKEPNKDIKFTVLPERVRCIRTDNEEDLGGVRIPREMQYAISINSSVPIVVQYGRLDTRNQPMAFYATTGYNF